MNADGDCMFLIIKKYIKLIRQFYFRYRVLSVAASCGPDLSVNGRSYVTTKTNLGRNVNFNGISIQGQGAISIGDNFHSGEGCLLISQNHNYDNGTAIPYDSSYICKDIIIGNQVWLGSRVIILPGVTIGEGAIVQAGSVVSKSIPSCAIAGGNPCQVFKYRDIDRYERLKNLGKFH